MSTQFITTTLLPIALGIIMFGFGLSLTPADFKRIFNYPKTITIGLICQMLFIPLLAFILCKTFNLSSQMSIGLMILAASPGGVTANIFSHLSHGDVALNLTLTAINSVLAAFTLPFFIYLAGALFSNESLQIGFQFSKTIEVFFIVLIPVVLGMIINNKQPARAKMLDKPFRVFSMLVLLVIVVGAILKEKALLSESIGEIGLVILIFNLASMGIGYAIPLLLKLNHKQATAISMEVGIHNSTLAIYIAMSVLGSITLALPAAIYSIIMFITAAIFSLILAKRNKI